MDRRRMILSSLAAPLLAQTSGTDGPARQWYELRWFYLRTGNHASKFLDLLKNHWAPTAKSLGIDVSWFQPVIGEQGPSVMMLSVFSSPNEAASSMPRLLQNADFAAAYKSANSPDPAFVRSDVSLLHAFSGHATLTAPPPLEHGSHIFEMRTYESNNLLSLRTKLEMFNGGEIGIFQRLGMSPVFFGEGIFGHNLPSLTYMLAFQSLAERERLWKEFGGDAEFTKLRTKPGYSDADIVASISNSILNPLPFSSVR
jgi:NIPSNAP